MAFRDDFAIGVGCRSRTWHVPVDVLDDEVAYSSDLC